MKLNKILTTVCFASLLLALGCAKKHKPDPDINANLEGSNTPMDFSAEGSDSGKIDGLYSVHFDYDRSILTKENRDILTKDVAWMNKHPKDFVQIEGHCDRHGSTEYNLALGDRRAKAVKDYMTALGVAGSRLSTISYGKERLLDTKESDEADLKNRRANFRPASDIGSPLGRA